MTYKISREQLVELYVAVRAEPGPAVPNVGAAALQRIARDGWAHDWIVEDLLMMADRRLSQYNTGFRVEALSEMLRLPLRSICHRPGARSNSVSFATAWEAEDAAALLVFLEMLSFNVDPSPLINALLPTLPKKGEITESQLEILWYTKRRAKSEVTVERQDVSGSLRGHECHTLVGGYKLVALIDMQGDPVSLTFTGPRHRRRSEPEFRTCANCGLTWLHGDPDSSAAHRKTHRKRMGVLDPQPNEQVLADRSGNSFDEHVDWRSPYWKHLEMSQRASAFKREEKYDFTMWGLPETDVDAHGFLFTEPGGAIVGACSFRLRSRQSDEPRWGLQWVWIAPGWRRKNILRSRWPALREQFGEFEIEGPVSPAMVSFAVQVGDEHLLPFSRGSGK